MHLAQELVDHIIDFLHNHPTTLLQASLVSRAWVGRTRTHLFKTIRITRPEQVTSSNLSYLTPLCKYAQTLRFTWPGNTFDPASVLDCFKHSELLFLTIYSCFELRDLDERSIRRCFTMFPCTSIITLELCGIPPADGTILNLLSLFPNADNLTISVASSRKVGPGPGPFGYEERMSVQRVSPRLGGSFKFSDPPGSDFFRYRRGRTLRAIAALPHQFQSVSLNIREQRWEDVLVFLGSCSRTSRTLFVEFPQRNITNQLVNQPTIDFVNLEELRVGVWAVYDPHSRTLHSLLQSITSPSLRRVIVEVRQIVVAVDGWSLLDEGLANLVERHKAYGDVKLQVSAKVKPEYLRKLLPRLAQKGMLELRCMADHS